MENMNDEEMIIKLPVKKSAISSVDGGVARINQSYLETFGEEDHHMVELRNEKKKVVVKLVADRLAPMNVIILRSGDMKDLKVSEGDEIEMIPYHSLTDDLKEKWEKLKNRFKRKEDEEEGGD